MCKWRTARRRHRAARPFPVRAFPNGGPLALVRTGDRIAADVPSRGIHLEVDDAELARQRAA